MGKVTVIQYEICSHSSQCVKVHMTNLNIPHHLEVNSESQCLTDEPDHINCKYRCFQTETAENIGYSCNMLREEMKEIFIVAASTAEGVKEELQ